MAKTTSDSILGVIRA